MLKTSIKTLRDCIKKNKLKAKILGGKYIVSELDLNNFINNYLTSKSDSND